jgi:hypothetical protein
LSSKTSLLAYLLPVYSLYSSALPYKTWVELYNFIGSKALIKGRYKILYKTQNATIQLSCIWYRKKVLLLT